MTTGLLDRPADLSARQWAEIVDALTRRELLAAGAALGVVGLGLGGQGSALAADAGWSYTDDLGRKIRMPHRPTRIASLWDQNTAALWAAGLHDLVASQLAPGNNSLLSETGVPRKTLTRLSVGNTPQVNLEALAAAKPDLIVDLASDGKLTTTSQQPTIAKIAPVVGLNSSGPNVTGIIGHAERLAVGLGAKLADTAPHARYRQALRRLERTVAAKPGLRVAFCFAGTDMLYVYTAKTTPWIPTLTAAGVDFMPAPPTPGPAAGGLHLVSWELVPRLPVDLLLETGGAWPITNPGWKAMPAVKAGQTHDTDGWGAGWYLYDYANYTTLLARLAAVIEQAKPGIGPK